MVGLLVACGDVAQGLKDAGSVLQDAAELLQDAGAGQDARAQEDAGQDAEATPLPTSADCKAYGDSTYKEYWATLQVPRDRVRAVWLCDQVHPDKVGVGVVTDCKLAVDVYQAKGELWVSCGTVLEGSPDNHWRRVDLVAP